MKVGIGAKIGVLCFALVALAAWIASQAFQRTKQVVVEHEVVDLGDDTHIQALRLRLEIERLRELCVEFAAEVSLRISEAPGGEEWPASATPLLGTSCRGLLSNNRLLSRASLVRAAADGVEVLAAQRAGSNGQVGLVEQPSLARPLTDKELAQSLRLSPNEVLLSEVQATGGTNHDRDRLVLHAAAPIFHAQRETTVGVAVVALDFDLVCQPLDLSPRHVTFLTNQRGEFLLHPRHEQELSSALHKPGRIQDQFAQLRPYYDKHPSLDEDELLETQGTGFMLSEAEVEQVFPSEQGRYFFVCRLDTARAFNLHSPKDRARLLDVLNDANRPSDAKSTPAAGREALDPAIRFSHGTRRTTGEVSISATTRRMVISGIRKADLEKLATRLRGEFGLDVPEPREARHFAVHFFKVYFDPMQPKRFVGLAWAASTEEIEADFNEEVSKSWWLITVVSMIALGLVPLFSVYITRPLKRLTQVTSQIATGVFDESSLMEAEQAPGEIGQLARSFHVMVEQVRERNQALEQLNEDLEQRVVERTAELRHANDHLAAARDHAFGASRAKSAFLANMSHELRTPLNAIIGFSEMLQEEATEAGNQSFVADLGKIKSSGKHLLVMINDILDHSKIEAGKVNLYLEEFDVGSMLDEVLNTVRPLAAKNNNQLRLECAPDLGIMRADMTRVRQVLFNLLSNACKFTDRGQVKLSAHREKSGGAEWVAFTVSDTGIGMTPDQVGKLFQEFSQLDSSTTRKFEGTGLGLAISKRLAELMGGTITVESERGRGSNFCLRLPAIVEDPSAAQPPSPVGGVPDSQAPARNTAEAPLAAREALILVIDDDHSASDLWQRFLAREGFQVRQAWTGEEGLQLARQLAPAAIVLDVVLPGMDGWSVLSALKSDPATSGIPIILSTILDDKTKGYALGAADYLTKPIEYERLSEALRRYKSDERTSPVLVVDDDISQRQVLRRLLERDGWPVLEAEHGRAALEILARHRPVLILLDLIMPEMNGFEFIEELRQHDAWRQIPVVIVTSADLEQKDRDQLNGYVQGILQKGAYARDELLELISRRVAECVRHQQIAEQAAIAAANPVD